MLNDDGTTFNWSSKADLAAAILNHSGTEVIPTSYEEQVQILLNAIDDAHLKEQVCLFDTSGSAQPMNFSREEYVKFIMDTLAVKERMDDKHNRFFNIDTLTKINAKKSMYKDVLSQWIFQTMASSRSSKISSMPHP